MEKPRLRNQPAEVEAQQRTSLMPQVSEARRRDRVQMLLLAAPDPN